MSNKRPDIPSPFCLRLSKEERKQLERDAGNMPLGTYIRSVLFDNITPRKRRRIKRPIKDHESLAQILAKLGSSRIAGNLNQLAKAANSGSLLLAPEIEADLRQALAEITWIRKTLMKSLGLHQHKSDDHDT